MFRAIPEVNRICAMADRGRRYRLHKEALAKIKSPVKRTQSACQTLPRKPLGGKARKEEQERITQENKKMLKAIITMSPTVNRAEMKEFELDHQHQVARKVHVNQYGFVSDKRNSVGKRKKTDPLPSLPDATDKPEEPLFETELEAKQTKQETTESEEAAPAPGTQDE